MTSTVNERVRHLRKDVLHLNQTKFGAEIGFKQTGASRFELPGRTIPDRVLMAICRRWNVREAWLRDGEGDIFEQDTLSGTANDVRSSLSDLYAGLDNERRAEFWAFVDAYIK